MRKGEAMKKAAALIVGSLLAVSLVGCDVTATPTDKRFGLEKTNINARIITDNVTGVYYLVISNGMDRGLAITPLLNPDGTPARVDNADYSDVKPDIDANTNEWIQDLLERQ